MIADYCIVGGGIAGTTAAEQIRKLDSDARIVILEREPYTLYSRVLIPHYLKNRIPRQNVFLRTISDYEKQDISLYTGAEVTAHDPVRHELSIHWGGGDDICTYKKLLIASGGSPKNVPVVFDNAGNTPVLRMQTLDDADHIKDMMERAPQKEALVIGEGFIGMEFIETFVLNHFRTKVLCRGDVFLETRFGPAAGFIIEDALQKRGVEFFKRTNEDKLENTVFAERDGTKQYPALIGMGIGIDRALKPFMGVEKQSGILADQHLVTNDPDIFVAGDVAEYYDELIGMHLMNGNWNSAFLQGVTVAKNMVASYRGEALPALFSAIPVYNIVHFGLMIMVIGDMRHCDDVWERAGSVYEPFLVRIGFREGKVVGAALMNRPKLQSAIIKLIQEKATKHDVETTF